VVVAPAGRQLDAIGAVSTGAGGSRRWVGLSWCQTVPDWLVRSTRAGTAAMFAGEFALTDRRRRVCCQALFMGMGLPLLVAGGERRRRRTLCLDQPRLCGQRPGLRRRPLSCRLCPGPSLGIRATLGVLVFTALVVALIAWSQAARLRGFLRAMGRHGFRPRPGFVLGSGASWRVYQVADPGTRVTCSIMARATTPR